MIKVSLLDFADIKCKIMDGLFQYENKTDPNSKVQFDVEGFLADAEPCVEDLLDETNSRERLEELKDFLLNTTCNREFNSLVWRYIDFIITDDDFMYNLGESRTLEAIKAEDLIGDIDREKYFSDYFNKWQDKFDWIDTDFLGVLVGDYVEQIIRVVFEWDNDVDEILGKYESRMKYKDNVYIATKEGIVKANEKI